MTDIEQEANEFAMALLMPREWLLADLKKIGPIDIEDVKPIEELAKKYRVSFAVMMRRIASLAATDGD